VTVEIVEAASAVLAWVLWEAVVVFVDFIKNPWKEVVDIGVDTRVLSLSAADTK
jgi:hypothetical protein